MLNTDIFQFEFVDRTVERQTIDTYLSDFSKSAGYALWLHGQRGTGKSFFLTKHVTAKKDFTSVYVNVEINIASPGAYLKEFISQLNKSADLKFTSYLRANYRSIASIGQKAVGVALNLADLDDLGLDELGGAISNHYISKRGEKESTVAVLKKYIAEALKKCERIVFVLDNFSLSDATSLDVIVPTIHEFLCDARIKFIICTTDDDLAKRFDIKSILAEKIPNKPMIIQPFDSKQLFARMLERTFDLDESNIRLLSQAFDLCQGVPQRFKEILINLYSAQGITVDGDKARFVKDVFRKLLIEGEISFDIDLLCQEQKGSKIILQVMALWGAPVSAGILYEFLEFLAGCDPITVLKEEARQTLMALEGLHILSPLFENNIVLYQFEHDSLKLAVTEHFRDDRSVPFLHYTIYEYLMTREENKDQPYWRSYYQSLLAYHSFAAHANGWIECNYAYGYTFFDAGLYKDAELIFSRLESDVTSLSGEQLLTMGITFYNCGRYSKADDLLSNIQSRALMTDFSPEQIIKLYTFQARARSCMLDSKRALEAIAQAERFDIEDRRLQIMLMGAKQSILFLAPGRFLEAKKLFDTLVELDANTSEMALVYQSAMDYYEGAESQALLNRGLALAKQFSDHITEGKIYNNMGFEDLRCENYEEARRHYEESISILKDLQPHEQVYPYSNLAVLHMISGEWELALDDIVEALFWNRSEYASLVLKTNRMLSYYFSGNRQWEKVYENLYRYISSEHCVDNKIYKKICINMALLASKEHGHVLEASKLLDRCRPYLETEWPHGKYRFLNLYQKVTGVKSELVPPPDPRYTKYYCGLEFEPWIVNFSHD